MLKARASRENYANFKPVDPEVTITSISTSGLVVLTFSKNMVVPPLEVLNNATIELNGKNFSALYPSVEPGYYSNPKDLKF